MSKNKNQDRQDRENRGNRNNQDQKQEIENVEFADEFLDLNVRDDNNQQTLNRNEKRKR